jgi:elongation factor G
MAFVDAVKKACPVVLEPVMQVVVTVDDWHVRQVLASLLKRRGEIQDRSHGPEGELIAARVPLAELFGFDAQLRAETHGQGSCSVRFACCQPVVQDPAEDDDRSAHLGAPRRPAPAPRTSAASVPEPDEGSEMATS